MPKRTFESKVTVMLFNAAEDKLEQHEYFNPTLDVFNAIKQEYSINKDYVKRCMLVKVLYFRKSMTADGSKPIFTRWSNQKAIDEHLNRKIGG